MPAPVTCRRSLLIRIYCFSASGTRQHIAPSRRPFIRMAELYLNLAECYAALDDTPNAIENLNMRSVERAGVRDLTRQQM